MTSPGVIDFPAPRPSWPEILNMKSPIVSPDLTTESEQAP